MFVDGPGPAPTVHQCWQNAESRAKTAQQEKLDAELTIYSALEMLKDGNTMRAMSVLEKRIDIIENRRTE